MKGRVAAVGVIAFAALGAFIPGSFRAQTALAQESAAAGSKTVWDGVYTQAQSDRGKQTYAALCQQCHGDELAGQDEAPPLAGSGFMSSWSGSSLGDLSETIQTSMPMTDPGTLTPDQTAEILAYVLNYNKFPAGKTELTHDTKLLKLITILSTKPDAK